MVPAQATVACLGGGHGHGEEGTGADPGVLSRGLWATLPWAPIFLLPGSLCCITGLGMWTLMWTVEGWVGLRELSWPSSLLWGAASSGLLILLRALPLCYLTMAMGGAWPVGSRPRSYTALCGGHCDWRGLTSATSGDPSLRPSSHRIPRWFVALGPGAVSPDEGRPAPLSVSW